MYSSLPSAEPDGYWILVEEISPGRFAIIDNSMTEGSEPSDDLYALGLCAWDDEVDDLDNWSDETCLGMSTSLLWHDVFITPTELYAPSIERLREALTHVMFCAWCPHDI